MKKVLICVDMTKDSLRLSKKTLKEIDGLGFDQIHLVHAFKENVYDFDFYFTTYPIKEDFEKINQSVLENLDNLITASEITSKDKVITNCIISDSPKESIDSYIKENNIVLGETNGNQTTQENVEDPYQGFGTIIRD